MPEKPRPSTLTDTLPRWRKFRGMTMEQVAARMNDLTGKTSFNKQAVYRFETGRRGVAPDMQKLFAQIFDCTVAELHEPPRERHQRPSLDKRLEGKPDSIWARVDAYIDGLLSSEDDEKR